MNIKYFNRHTQKIEEEKVYGDKAIKWLYLSQSGKLMGKILSSPFFSSVYGMVQDTSWSRRKIPEFVDKFNIQTDEFLAQDGHEDDEPYFYESFNQFFIRRFKNGVRNFTQNDNEMPAFCEARYYGFDTVNENVELPVKGTYLHARDLVARNRWAEVFEGGPCLIARLCPVDYHRFHFPDKGRFVDQYPVHGALHSVNPIALKARSDIFITNKREVSILETKNFGHLAYIEVGATCVGTIQQTHHSSDFDRGKEKGYFLFGGSTVILLGEPRKWSPIDDVLEKTHQGLEVYSRLGEVIAKKL